VEGACLKKKAHDAGELASLEAEVTSPKSSSDSSLALRILFGFTLWLYLIYRFQNFSNLLLPRFATLKWRNAFVSKNGNTVREATTIKLAKLFTFDLFILFARPNREWHRLLRFRFKWTALGAAARAHEFWRKSRVRADAKAHFAFKESPNRLTIDHSDYTGVSDVKATLEDQKIKVQYDAAQANPQDMLTALKKWGDAGNKKVELI
jgi:hypothetical protein